MVVRQPRRHRRVRRGCGSCSSASSTSPSSSSCRRRRSSPSSPTIRAFYLDAALVTARHALVGIAARARRSSIVVGAVARLVALPRAGGAAGPRADPRRPVGRLLHVDRRLARARATRRCCSSSRSSPSRRSCSPPSPGCARADPAARELLASVNASRARGAVAAAPAVGAARCCSPRRATSIGLALAAAYYGEGGNLTSVGEGGLGAIGRSAASQSQGRPLWATMLRHRRCSASSASASSRSSSGSLLALARVATPRRRCDAGTRSARPGPAAVWRHRRPACTEHNRHLARSTSMRQRAAVAIAARRRRRCVGAGDDDAVPPDVVQPTRGGAVHRGALRGQPRGRARSPTSPGSTSPPRRRWSTCSSPSSAATTTSCASTSRCIASFSTANYPLIAGGEAQFASGGSFSEVSTSPSANDADLVAVVVEGRSPIDALILKPGTADDARRPRRVDDRRQGQDHAERRGDARRRRARRGRGLRDGAARRLRPGRPHRPRRDRRVPRLQEQRAGHARAGRHRRSTCSTRPTTTSPARSA